MDSILWTINFNSIRLCKIITLDDILASSHNKRSLQNNFWTINYWQSIWITTCQTLLNYETIWYSYIKNIKKEFELITSSKRGKINQSKNFYIERLMTMWRMKNTKLQWSPLWWLYKDLEDEEHNEQKRYTSIKLV